MSTTYDYHTFELARGRASWSAFAAHVRDRARKAISDEGAELLGLFSPQLGFASNEALVLVRRDGTHALPANAFAAAEVIAQRGETLAPTVRPRPNQRLITGGIYVH